MKVYTTTTTIFWNNNSEDKPSSLLINGLNWVLNDNVKINDDNFTSLKAVVPTIDINYIKIEKDKTYYYYLDNILKQLPNGYIVSFTLDNFVTFTLPTLEKMSNDNIELLTIRTHNTTAILDTKRFKYVDVELKDLNLNTKAIPTSWVWNNKGLDNGEIHQHDKPKDVLSPNQIMLKWYGNWNSNKHDMFISKNYDGYDWNYQVYEVYAGSPFDRGHVSGGGGGNLDGFYNENYFLVPKFIPKAIPLEIQEHYSNFIINYAQNLSSNYTITGSSYGFNTEYNVSLSNHIASPSTSLTGASKYIGKFILPTVGSFNMEPYIGNVTQRLEGGIGTSVVNKFLVYVMNGKLETLGNVYGLYQINLDGLDTLPEGEKFIDLSILNVLNYSYFDNELNASRVNLDYDGMNKKYAQISLAGEMTFTNQGILALNNEFKEQCTLPLPQQLSSLTDTYKQAIASSYNTMNTSWFVERQKGLNWLMMAKESNFGVIPSVVSFLGGGVSSIAQRIAKYKDIANTAKAGIISSSESAVRDDFLLSYANGNGVTFLKNFDEQLVQIANNRIYQKGIYYNGILNVKDVINSYGTNRNFCYFMFDKENVEYELLKYVKDVPNQYINIIRNDLIGGVRLWKTLP